MERQEYIDRQWEQICEQYPMLFHGMREDQIELLKLLHTDVFLAGMLYESKRRAELCSE